MKIFSEKESMNFQTIEEFVKGHFIKEVEGNFPKDDNFYLPKSDITYHTEYDEQNKKLKFIFSQDIEEKEIGLIHTVKCAFLIWCKQTFNGYCYVTKDCQA